MTEYFFLFRGGTYPEKGSDAHAAHMQAWMDWMKALRDEGALKSGLPFTMEGKILSGENGDVVDGLVDVDLGGYLHVSAASFDDAVAMAKGSPALSVGGTVEVRECIVM